MGALCKAGIERISHGMSIRLLCYGDVPDFLGKVWVNRLDSLNQPDTTPCSFRRGADGLDLVQRILDRVDVGIVVALVSPRQGI